MAEVNQAKTIPRSGSDTAPDLNPILGGVAFFAGVGDL